MRFFIDTEFIENGYENPIQLLSIAVVAEDGRHFYAETISSVGPQHEWVMQHVVPHFTGPRMDRDKIRDGIWELVSSYPGTPEFWGYFADYDWVLFCQLFGKMIDLPPGWPMYCSDLKQRADTLHVSKKLFPKPLGIEHHALEDARWNVKLHDFLWALERHSNAG